MKKSTLVNIHLSLSALFAPFLLLIAITGTSYLFLEKGHSTSSLVGNINSNDIDKKIITEALASINPNYKFEYIKGSVNKMITRPTTRLSYEFIKKNNTYEVYEIRPNLLKRLIEVHKGHGPKLLKWLQKLLGICLVLILITGILISFKSKEHRKKSISFMSVGFLILAYMFYGL